jgi:hypothetical protein
MAEFLIETTNEDGVVEERRVSLDQTRLDLAFRSLVRIVGLERATTLQRLQVPRPIVAFLLVLNLTHARRFRAARQQPLRRRASVCARIDTARASRRESRSLPFVSSLVVADSTAAQLEPLVVSTRCNMSNVGLDSPRRAN